MGLEMSNETEKPAQFVQVIVIEALKYPNVNLAVSFPDVIGKQKCGHSAREQERLLGVPKHPAHTSIIVLCALK